MEAGFRSLFYCSTSPQEENTGDLEEFSKTSSKTNSTASRAMDEKGE